MCCLERAGGDGRPSQAVVEAFKAKNGRKPLNIKDIKDDLTVLRHIWFSKARGSDHAARLESFYGGQAEACESSVQLQSSPALSARSDHTQ